MPLENYITKGNELRLFSSENPVNKQLTSLNILNDSIQYKKCR